MPSAMNSGFGSEDTGTMGSRVTRDGERTFQKQQQTVFLALFMSFVIHTACRRALGIAAPLAVARNELSVSALGQISSISSLAYAIAKPFGGVLADRMDAVKGLCLSLLGAAIAMLGMACAVSDAQRCLAAALLGVAQAPSWPVVALPLRAWYGRRKRPRAWAWMSASQTTGGAVAVVVLGAVGQAFGTLHAPLLCAAGMAAVGAVLLPWMIHASTPEAMGMSVTDDGDEKDSDVKVDPNAKPLSVGTLVWISVSSRSTQLFAASAFFLYVIKEMFSVWMAVMLSRTRGFDPSDPRLNMIMLALDLSGVPGCLLASELSRHSFNNNHARAAMWMAVVLLGGATVVLHSAGDATAPMWVFCLGAGAAGAGINGIQTLSSLGYTEAADPRAQGTVSGVVGLAAYMGAFAAGQPFAFAMDVYGVDTAFFMTLTMCTAMVGTLLMLVSTSKSKQA